VAEKKTIREVWWEKQEMKPRKQDSSVGLVGQWEITVMEGGRIKLPADVLRMLQSLKPQSKKLYPGRIPLTKALVLVPAQFWDHWKEALLSEFSLLQAHPGAAAYLNPFKPVGWDRQGRVSLPALPSNYIAIRKGGGIILVGKGYYVELWTEEEFKRAFKDCEAALAKADLQPNDTRSTGACHLRTQDGGT
jgi:DNA-binding transcriptional regulator/RsmH inhibitor MraZ